MDPESNEIDAESPKMELFRESTALQKKIDNNNVVFLEAAALLTIWSILVINEGAIRLIASDPNAGFDRDVRPHPILPFLGGLFEVIFGLLGLFVGMAGFIFRWFNTNLTIAAMIIQSFLGYYVFAVFVFVRPTFQALDLQKPLLEELSLGESKLLIALGVLTSFHFCLALQGGQFVFFARMISAGSGKDFLKQRTGNRMRAVFWNVNLAFSGVWTTITGVLIGVSVGGGKLDKPFISPPNVGRLPGLTIATGILMVIWACYGIAMSMSRNPPPGHYYLLSGIVYVFAFLNFTIVQFGLLNPNGGAVAMHAGLVYMVVFMGPYFVHLASKEDVHSS